jgi:hypothetical protein
VNPSLDPLWSSLLASSKSWLDIHFAIADSL